MKILSDTDPIKSTTPFIGYVDLIGKGNVKLTVEDVQDVSGDKVDGVREAKPGTYALVLKGTDRKLHIQGRKKKFLMRTFGTKKSDWVGKTVEIYGDANVKFGRETVGGWKFVGMEPAGGGQ